MKGEPASTNSGRALLSRSGLIIGKAIIGLGYLITKEVVAH